MKIYGTDRNGCTIAHEMDDLYADNTSDGIVLNPPTTNKKKKKKGKTIDPKRKAKKTVPSKTKETDVGEQES